VFAVVCAAGIVAFAGPLGAESAPCTPRVGEKLGVRFVELCAGHTADFADAEAHEPEALPAFWIAATPLPCSHGGHDVVGCDPVTALEASPLEGPGKNRPLDALVVDATTAHRICTLRFGGRLPTPLEREQARQALGLASLLVREAPGDYAVLWLDDLPEWVAEGDCAAAPAKPGPGCRITQFPPVSPRPRRSGDRLLACVAEPAREGAQRTAIGGECTERPAEGGVRSPNCAVGVPGVAGGFELGCEEEARSGSADPQPDRAALRCVVAETALGTRPGR
jgi:hypothetical protein